ncbi:MAG: DEAD/DEAH box helicase [Acidimicrobiaceae bacterium]|nr:DEAD/DEAH box helicase [Acidimicrobiaceae bacterium]MYE98558.1 DEAD/DEAH box helicase [Acidimicrobiaceae bacterium]MYH42597.1 DEAD/DEAH box helicase [Acidimicrobiaceae bacterium]MYI53103.1 DEAD/DEAH box helicase [Acidimicrobiaceae bacterium]MYK74826.1 DEAD/DEAH box helicase [Acidimicrobiaceae bacterium]
MRLPARVLTVTAAAGPGFVLDNFQRRAIEQLDAGRSVLVSAPTGSGKTVVADHAVDRALAAGQRAFYTTPIKALSNQKYRDLRQRLGPHRVGLLTGDNVIAGDADVVVMTTEVLRNMLYAGAVSERLGAVVLDEVHYLEDPYRGPVWEEVILHLPSSVVLVCLSATVSNHEQLGGWLKQVRGPTAVVVETRRPVPLTNLYAVGRRRSDAVQIVPTLVDGRPNSEGGRFDAPARSRERRGSGRSRHGGPRGSGRSRHGGPRGSGGSEHRGQRPPVIWRPPRRVDLLAELEERGLLPVIWFVFSRKGCDQAAARLVRDGARLTEDAEAARIDEMVEARLGLLDPADLAALGAERFLDRLRLGIASHHAGLVPVFKEAVEQCFAEGLVKVVFATETLALGVNMPARSVVIDKPVKYDGRRTAPLSAAQYTQFTGRAGRRGIDREGWAVALWSPDSTFEQAARLASSRSFELRSAFRPTYNMVAGLLGRMSAEAARDLMGRSFAQYQAETASLPVDLARRFDAVAGVLRERGHLDGWTLTDSGSLVSRIFHEADLAVAEALSGGLLDGLSPPELASVLSAFTYEHRSPGPRPEVWIPSGAAYRRLLRIGAVLDSLHRTERDFGVERTRPLETGFGPAAHRWAAGESFEALQDAGFSAGDFVRNVKQVIDLARRIAAVAPGPATSATAHRTVTALNRGVVALSGTIEPADSSAA